MPDYDMEVTPERAEKIKQALIRQYEDQFNVEVIGYTEIKKETEDAPAQTGEGGQALYKKDLEVDRG